MKNLVSYIFLVVVLIALITSSCDCKDHEPFIGNWEMQSSQIDTLINNVVVDDTLITYDPGDLWIEIKEDYTGVQHYNGSLSTFTWSVTNNIIAIVFPGQAALYLEYTLVEPIFRWDVTTYNISNYPNPGDNFKVVRHETAKRM